MKRRPTKSARLAELLAKPIPIDLHTVLADPKFRPFYKGWRLSRDERRFFATTIEGILNLKSAD